MSLTKLNKYLLAATFIGAFTFTGCGEAPNQQHGALPVDVYLVENKDVSVISHLTGRANATRKAEVRPQVNGILQKRLFEEGAFVTQGQQLYQIDPS
ncbi:MAG: efflux transporter periplasmic adaptor subunit, partial [Succinivibrio sp.]